MSLDKFPKEIKVGWKIYSVNTDLDVHECHEARIETEDCLGITFPESHIMSFSASEEFNEVSLKETLLHEILHACWHMSYLGNDEAIEELTVGGLSHVLFGVIRDNPEIFKLMMKE